MNSDSLSMDCLFRARGDPTGSAIVEQLAGRAASISELAQPFDMALSTFMQHLGVLETVGLVSSSKLGRVRTCSLNEEKNGGCLDLVRGTKESYGQSLLIRSP